MWLWSEWAYTKYSFNLISFYQAFNSFPYEQRSFPVPTVSVKLKPLSYRLIPDVSSCTILPDYWLNIVLFYVIHLYYYECIYQILLDFLHALQMAYISLYWTCSISIVQRKHLAYRNSLESVPGTKQYWSKFFAQGNDGLQLLIFKQLKYL